MNTDPTPQVAPGRRAADVEAEREHEETRRRYASALETREASMRAMRERILGRFEPPPAPRRVVVVDDQRPFIDALELYFDGLDDVEVVGFTDPQAALDYLDSDEVDSVVGAVVDLDLRHHHLDGLDVLERLPRDRVAWICTGALNADPLLERAAERYSARVIVKPGDSERFDELVASFRERISIVH